jgi:hypothetical protein
MRISVSRSRDGLLAFDDRNCSICPRHGPIRDMCSRPQRHVGHRAAVLCTRSSFARNGVDGVRQAVCVASCRHVSRASRCPPRDLVGMALSGLSRAAAPRPNAAWPSGQGMIAVTACLPGKTQGHRDCTLVRQPKDGRSQGPHFRGAEKSKGLGVSA